VRPGERFVDGKGFLEQGAVGLAFNIQDPLRDQTGRIGGAATMIKP
jgi:hypothetical protein